MGWADLRIRRVGPDAEPQLMADLSALLRRLRPGLTDDRFGELLSEGYAQGLRYLVAYPSGGEPQAAAGYRVLVTSRGRILFVEDLVTAENARSQGIGARLMDALHESGRRAGCARLELDSGISNAAAHRFYFRSRMSVTAFHFAGDLDRPRP